MICSFCDGYGKIAPSVECPKCGGRGNIWIHDLGTHAATERVRVRPDKGWWSRWYLWAYVFVSMLILPYRRDLHYNDLGEDLHTYISLSMAANWIECGKFSSISVPLDRYRDDLRPQADPYDKPLASFAHCGSLQPFTNNENSLMYLESVVLWLKPTITLRQLGLVFVVLRVLIGCALVGSLSGSGWFKFATGFGYLGLLRWMDGGVMFALYGWILPLLMLFMAVLLWSKTHRAVRAVLAGLLAAFLLNMRYEYGMVCLFLLFVYFEYDRRRLSAPASSREAANQL